MHGLVGLAIESSVTPSRVFRVPDPAGARPGFLHLASPLAYARPVALSDGRASCTWAAIDGSEPGLSLDSLKGMTANCRWVVLTLGSDMCSANMRLKAWVLSQALAHAVREPDQEDDEVGTLLVLLVDCNSHILNNIVVRTFRSTEFIDRTDPSTVPEDATQFLRGLWSFCSPPAPAVLPGFSAVPP